MGERNMRIRKSIENREIPLLPYERELAQRAIKTHATRQEELGKKMGEAMHQSSETWHDNSPAEVIMNDSKLLAAAAQEIIKVIRSGRIFDYENDDNRVSIGSLVGVKYEGDDDTTMIYLTGATRELPPQEVLEAIGNGHKNFDNVDCVTLSSPVGQAIFDKPVGETIQLDIESGISLTIVTID